METFTQEDALNSQDIGYETKPGGREGSETDIDIEAKGHPL